MSSTLKNLTNYGSILNPPNSNKNIKRTNSDFSNSQLNYQENINDNDEDIQFYTGNSAKKLRNMRRQSSVILANTGERVHRSISFSSDNHTGIETDALINGSRSNILRSLIETYYSDIFRNVIRCSLAYLIASLGVYWTPFDDFLGQTDSKHIIATVAVYFHPSRSKGSMNQTLIFVIVSLLYCFSVSFGCRAISTYFFKNGEDEISYAIDLIVSSIALGSIAFMKQKVNKQTFNTACSLASISVVACVVKEGSLNSANIPIERLQSILHVVVTGCVISVAMCYLLWPISAVKSLRESLNDSFNLMSSILSLAANRFLRGEKVSAKEAEIFNALKDNIQRLNTNLEEAKFELKLKGREEEWLVFKQLVEITIALARHLQALRSSTEIQWNLLNQNSEDNDSYSSLKSYTSDILRLSQSVENMDSVNAKSNISYTANNSEQLFDLFVYYLAPSMKSFIFTIKGVLSEIPFENAEAPNTFTKTTNLQKSLYEAINLFNTKQLKSFEKLYSQAIFKSNDFLFKTDQEEVTACCGNFSSLLGLFATELIEFLKLSEVYEEARSKSRSWNWLKFWKKSVQEELPMEATLNEALLCLQSQYGPKRKRDLNSCSFKLWKALKIFRRIDVQFGIRVGLGALCLSIFAFYPKTKVIFNSWRGEWALTVYCIMMNKSLGGTTMTVKWRFLGTFLGAYSAYLIWILTDGNVYALSITGFLISIPCFYIIIYWKKNNPFGRFILLTYNLTALYSYSMTQKDAEDGHEGGENPIIGEIAFHRFIAVSIGIIWSLTMASCILPNSARARLKIGLTILWLRLGVIWNSDPLKYDPQTHMLTGLKDEKGLNALLQECETLLKQAPLEFRLKGSFPKSTYESLLRHTSKVIDTFQNMNLMIKVDPHLSPNEEYVLQYIESERNEIEHRIFLIFYMVASAMRLGFPLPNKPASTEHAKDRMLVKLNEIRNNISLDITLTNEDYVLLYSYILVTSSISEELDAIIDLIKDLLGDITEEIFQLV